MSPPNKAAQWLMSLLALTTLTAAAPSKHRKSKASIEWKDCEPAGVKCATMEVPADWTKLDGPKITLGMNMLPAKDQEKRLGYLFMNPGGPGGLATEAVVGYEQLGYWSDDVREQYDIVGVDPRGIGTSTRIICDPDLFNKRQTLRPSTEEEFNAMVSHWKAFSESCEKLTKPTELYSHVDTISFVQDLEAVRKAVGDDKFNYIGLSYGTQVGQQYAARYPDTVGRMVLDANMDHSLPETASNYIDAMTYEDVAGRFFTWAGQNSSSVLQGQDVTQLFDNLTSNATAQAIPVPQDAEGSKELRSDVNGEEIRIWLHDALAFVGNWPGVAQALQEASSGNGTLVATPLALDTNSSRSSNLWGGYAVACQDDPATSTYAEYLNKKTMIDSLHMHTQGLGTLWMMQTTCIGWTAPLVNPPKVENVVTAQPILLVNALYDPATSFAFATGVQTQFKNSVLIARDGIGHGSLEYSTTGGETARAMSDYLVKGTLPKAGTVYQS